MSPRYSAAPAARIAAGETEVFSALDFDIVWSAAARVRPPFPLSVPSVGATVEDRDDMRSLVFGRLAGRGLVNADGNRLAPSWDDLFAALAEPDLAVDVVGTLDGPVRGLAAVRGDAAALAVQEGTSVAVTPIRPDAVVEAAVALLPDAPAGPGRHVSGRLAAIRAYLDGGTTPGHHEDDEDADPLAGSHDRSERQALAAAGMRPDDALLLLSLANGRVAGGQFGVAVGGPGPARRATPPLSWFDTDEGRYLMTNDGEWLTVEPADGPTLVAHLHGMAADA